MKPKSPKEPSPLSHMAAVLLDELREECAIAIALIDTLKKRGSLTRSAQEDLLGELSASIIHLHIHTDGLDDVVVDSTNPRVSERAASPRSQTKPRGVRALAPRRVATVR